MISDTGQNLLNEHFIKKATLSNCGAREDSSESLGQQGNQTSPKGKQP